MTKLYGTRFTTGCGHSWKRTYPKWDIHTLRYATSDCRVCGALCIVDENQFSSQDDYRFPFHVHMPLFHIYLNRKDPRWPVDGTGTGYVSFETE